MKKKLLIAGMVITLSALTIGCGSKAHPEEGVSATISKIEVDAGEDKEEVTEDTKTEEDNKDSSEETSTSVSEEKEDPKEIEEEKKEEEKKDEEEKEEESEEKEAVDYVKAYSKILDRAYEILVEEDFWDNEKEGEVGIMEARAMSDNALSSVGYLLKDMAGKDKVPELFIVYDCGIKHEVLAAYKLVNGAPELILEGFNRSAYSYAGDNAFVYEGSGGAAYSATGKFILSDDTVTLVNEDFYFSDTDEDFNPLYFHNTTGEWDKEKSEQLDIADADFYVLCDEYSSMGMRFDDVIPMAVYGAEIQSEKADSEVIIAWANDVLSDASVYEDVIIDRDDYTSKIAFSTKSVTKNFMIIKLEMGDMDGDNITFSYEPVYSQEELNKDKLVVATISFPGDMPTYGFAYTDEEGNVKTYAISVSGKDGSLNIFKFDAVEKED